MANDPILLPPLLAAPLALRLNGLPQILAGPILRRVDASSVTVWIALRSQHEVNLQVFALQTGGSLMESSFTSASKVGESLYILAVTATSATPVLSPGNIYTYNLQFRPAGSGQTYDLYTKGYWNAGDPTTGVDNTVAAKIGYPGILKPSFALPPPTMIDLKIVQGSCRKPHGDSIDALEGVDTMLSGPMPATDPLKRPHQLLLTGDQIYADDVAHIMLALVTDAARTLIGAPELIPTLSADGQPAETARFGPATRTDKIQKEGGFTSTAASCHLFSFGEYAAMYLLAWSDVLWPATLPAYDEIFRTGTEANPGHLPRTNPDKSPYWAFKESEAQRESLGSFRLSLPRVRTVLANVPTYMILDDHDVTDDWLMNRQFCEDVISSALGSRVMLNALAAYAWFQGWGNVGNASGPGDVRPALTAYQAWQQAGFPPAGPSLTELATILGIPTSLPAAVGAEVALLPKDPSAIAWYYALSWDTHELLVVDSRTRRGYRAAPLASAALIAETAQGAQIGLPLPPALEDKVTIVVVPGPLVGIPFIETHQRHASGKDAVFGMDVEVWSFDATAFETFVSTLSARGLRQRKAVIISGDVHYGFGYRYQYWAAHPLSDPGNGASEAIFALMTSSAFKNETGSELTHTRTLHRTGFGSTLKTEKRANTRLTYNLTAAQMGRERTNIGIGLAPPKAAYTAKTDRKVGVVSNLLNEATIHNDQVADVRFSRLPDSIAVSTFLHSDAKNVTFPPLPDSPADPGPRLANTLDGVKLALAAYYDNLAPGVEIVGVNNVGVIRFEFRDLPSAPHTLFVVQDLWWRAGTRQSLYQAQRNGTLAPLQPLTQLPAQLTIDPQPVLKTTP